MTRYYYDFHVHSCLSPCGDNDNTPNNLAGMASLNGVTLMALTDHNSSRNCPAFFKAARRYGIVPVVCLFETLEEALSFNDEVDEKRIRIKNREEVFGEQLILDENDEIIGREEDLLINATMIALDEVPAMVAKYRGICYPAHIDRQANGAISILGDFPHYVGFRMAELNDAANKETYVEKYGLQNLKIMVSSDAHYLDQLREDNDYFDIDDEPYSSQLVRQRLFEKLRSL